MPFILLIPIIIILLISIRLVNEYERGVRFTLGKFLGITDPGWQLFCQFSEHEKVDIRIKAVDVPFQEAVIKDNVYIPLEILRTFERMGEYFRR